MFVRAVLVTGILAGGIRVASAQENLLHVDQRNCRGAGSGTVNDPFCTVQAAVDAAEHGDAIMVAPGIYTERPDLLGKAVTLRGRVPHDDAVVAQTIIDGSAVDPLAAAQDSVVRLVDHDPQDGPVVLEGLTLRGGTAQEHGGGIYCRNSSAVIRNCVLTGNRAPSGTGGGLYCLDSTVQVVNCRMHGNQAPEGAGLFAESSTVTLQRVRLSLNQGGAARMRFSHVMLTSCLVTDNQSNDAAGLDSIAGTLEIRNCTFSRNVGGGTIGTVSATGGDVTIDHSILWANGDTAEIVVNDTNLEVWYSAVEGGLEGLLVGGGTLEWQHSQSSDPLFRDPFSGDYHLFPDSPAVDAGDPSATPLAGELDLDGRPRLLGARIDLGAYETAADCDGDGRSDQQELSSGESSDCNANGVPDNCEADTDGDGWIDDCDGCPLDSLKQAPGLCGCGVDDSDDDQDGTPDCAVPAEPTGGTDLCPADPLKIVPGICGCGVADSDGDEDGVADCVDLCPGYDDDADADGDGAPDDCDECPADPMKSTSGICGCGVSEDDDDQDGVPDCSDLCAGSNDAFDQDGDSQPDGCDDCPVVPHVSDHPACFTLERGGTCGTADDCRDGLFCNGIEACVDGLCRGGDLPCLPSEQCLENVDLCIAVQVGGDGDGVEDAWDNCPQALNPNQFDWDGDGLGDVCDLDDDHDGVHDELDECSGSALGAETTNAGCPAEPVEPESAEALVTVELIAINQTRVGDAAHVTYELHVHNHGPAIAHDVGVRLELDATSPWMVVEASHGALLQNGVLYWPAVGAVASGATFTRTVRLSVDADFISDTPLTIPVVAISNPPAPRPDLASEVQDTLPAHGGEPAPQPDSTEPADDVHPPSIGICGTGCGAGGATFAGLLLSLALTRTGRRRSVSRRAASC